jgi:hypothetical protein
VAIALDDRCERREGGVTCRISASDTSPVTMILVAPAGGTVAATLVPGADDPEPDNNTWQTVLR